MCGQRRRRTQTVQARSLSEIDATQLDVAEEFLDSPADDPS
jgi:hypothetical protein